MTLRHQGFDAKSFSSPFEALQAARCEAPDLLISDVLMPRLSGIDLAIQVHERCPNCRILLLSGQATTVRMLKTAETKGHKFEVLNKPIDLAALLKKIQMTPDNPYVPL